MSKKEEKKRKIEWKRHCFAVSLAENPKNMSKKNQNYNEFIEKGYYDKLTDHYNTPDDRMSMLAELYKEEDKKGKVKVKTDKNSK